MASLWGGWCWVRKLTDLGRLEKTLRRARVGDHADDGARDAKADTVNATKGRGQEAQSARPLDLSVDKHPSKEDEQLEKGRLGQLPLLLGRPRAGKDGWVTKGRISQISPRFNRLRPSRTPSGDVPLKLGKLGMSTVGVRTLSCTEAEC